MKRLLLIPVLLLVTLSLFAAPGGEAGAASGMDIPVIFRVGNGAEPESLDPALVSGTPEHRIYVALFEGLVTYDPETAEPIPGIAESWDVSADGSIYTFHLRNATWSDGVAITADTVVGSWTRFLAPETAAQYAWMPSMVVKGAAEFNSGDAGAEVLGFRAVDRNTVELELVGPAPYIVGMLAHYAFAIHPLHVIERYGDQWTLPENIVSNGPYVLSEWRPQERLVAKRNPRYWNADAVSVDEIVFFPIDDNNTSYNMYVNGELDWALTVPLDQIDAAKLRDDYQDPPQLATYYYIFNNQRAPLDDPRVRKALSMAVDRQELVDRVTRGGQIPTTAITPPMAGYTPPRGNPYNVAGAQQLLAEAGYPGGQGLRTMTLLYNTSEGHKKIAEYIQQVWQEELGVTVELENQEWATYLSTRRAGEFDIARAGWVGDYLDPNTFLELFTTGSQSSMNGGAYGNPEYDKLVESAPMIADAAERLATLQAAEEIFVGQDQGNMPIYYYVDIDMIDTSRWGGWYGNTLGVHPYQFLYLK